MDLKARTRSKIIHTILRHTHSSNSWRILIIHKFTTKILTTIFTQDELIFHDILNYDYLENTARKPVPDHPAIYFVHPTDTTIKNIQNDIKSKMYLRYTVFFTEDPSCNVKFDYQVVNINYICHAKNVFTCDVMDLQCIADLMGHGFNINYYGNNQNVSERLDKLMGTVRKGELIIYDRMCDLITPLVRFYTFESLLRDFKICDEFDETSELWMNVRYEHIRDVNIILSREAKKLNRDIAKLKDVGTKDLIKMVYEAPEKVHLKEEVSKYLNFLDKAITKFEKENLNFLSLTEQNIIMKVDQNNNKYTEGVKDFMKICKNEEVTLHDKKKLFFVLNIMGYDFQNSENNELIKLGIVDQDDMLVKNEFNKLRHNNVIMKNNEFEYTISRFKPLLFHILDDFLDKNKLTKSVGKSKANDVVSLRKSEFIYSSNSKHKKFICVYICGGLTYEEIKVADEISKKWRVNVIIGSDEIIGSSDQFYNKIKNHK